MRTPGIYCGSRRISTAQGSRSKSGPTVNMRVKYLRNSGAGRESVRLSPPKAGVHVGPDAWFSQEIAGLGKAVAAVAVRGSFEGAPVSLRKRIQLSFPNHEHVSW